MLLVFCVTCERQDQMELKKRIAFFLLVAFLAASFAPVYASAYRRDYDNKHLTKLFYEADADEVVAYYEGQPVRKKDIIEATGQIKTSRINEIKQFNSAEKNDANYADNQGTSTGIAAFLPPGRNEAIVVKGVSAPRYGQEDTYYYLTTRSGRELALTFDRNDYNAFLWVLAGFISDYGPIITLIGFFLDTWNAGVAAEIRHWTDQDHNIVWLVNDTPYGSFYTVDFWDGRTIDLDEHTSEFTRVWVKSISYRTAY